MESGVKYGGLVVFQSSPSFEAGRYLHVRITGTAYTGFQSSPSFEAGRYQRDRASIDAHSSFQSSPSFEAGRYACTEYWERHNFVPILTQL